MDILNSFYGQNQMMLIWRDLNDFELTILPLSYSKCEHFSAYQQLTKFLGDLIADNDDSLDGVCSLA
jgi:hypothetical protein